MERFFSLFTKVHLGKLRRFLVSFFYHNHKMKLQSILSNYPFMKAQGFQLRHKSNINSNSRQTFNHLQKININSTPFDHTGNTYSWLISYRIKVEPTFHNYFTSSNSYFSSTLDENASLIIAVISIWVLCGLLMIRYERETAAQIIKRDSHQNYA